MTPFAGHLASLVADELTSIQGGQHGYATRNVRTWPCISGEATPPTFSVVSGGDLPAYSSAAPGRPAILHGAATVDDQSVVTWPKPPRVSIDSLAVLSLRWQVYIVTKPTGNGGGMFLTMGAYQFLATTASGFWQVRAGATTTVTTVTYSAGVWYDLRVKFTATSVLFYIDGVLVHTDTITPLAVDGITSGPTANLYHGNTGGVAATAYTAFHEQTWEAA